MEQWQHVIRIAALWQGHLSCQSEASAGADCQKGMLTNPVPVSVFSQSEALPDEHSQSCMLAAHVLAYAPLLLYSSEGRVDNSRKVLKAGEARVRRY